MTSILLAAMILVPQDAPRPKVDVVFVVDTTGSMGGLIDGAKRKIWAITNQIAKSEPTPELRIGLVAYRDKGDAYVTKRFDLTDDLDAVYGELTGYAADGGGDGPENVRQALHDAIATASWSKAEGALKILFLVGDAPPHLDYEDVPTVEALCKSAIDRDIIINTIRCGGDADAGRIWQEIARAAEGDYFSIDQDGGVAAIATPFDKELAELSDKIGRTVIAFGDEQKRNEVEATEKDAAEELSDDVKAERACAKGYVGRLYRDDLIDACKEGRVKLEDVKDEELPEEMRKMTPEERKAHVEKKAKERADLSEKVKQLSKKREAHIAEELKKQGKEDAFDVVVKKTLNKQMEKAGLNVDKE